MSFRSIFAPAKFYIFSIDLLSIFLISLYMTNMMSVPTDDVNSYAVSGETRTLELPSDIKPVSVIIPSIGLNTDIELLGAHRLTKS